jgi:hypothetical protein
VSGGTVAAHDQLDILQLVARYGHLIDGGRAGEVHGLFTDDAIWESAEVRMDGNDAIAKGFGRRQQQQRESRHVCTGTVLEPDPSGSDDVLGWTTFTLYRFDGPHDGPAPLLPPVMIGTYHDRFRRTPDGWRIAHRRATAELVERMDP